MSELTVNDFPIGQKIGAIWRTRREDKDTFKLQVSKVSSITINKSGIKVTTSPKIFRCALEIDEFYDYREIDKNGLIVVDTPLLLTDKTVEHLEKVVELWKDKPPMCGRKLVE